MSTQSELTDRQREEIRTIASSLFDNFKTSIQTEVKKLTDLLSDPGLKQYLQTRRPGKAYGSLLDSHTGKRTEQKVNRVSVPKEKKPLKAEAEVSHKKLVESNPSVHEQKPERKKSEQSNEKGVEDKKKQGIRKELKYPKSPSHEKQKIYKEPRRNLSNADNVSGAMNAAKRNIKGEKANLQTEGKKPRPPTTKKSSRSSKLEALKKPEELHEHKKEEGIKKEAVMGPKKVVEHKEKEPEHNKELPKERKLSNVKEINAEKKPTKKVQESKEPAHKEKVEVSPKAKAQPKGMNSSKELHKGDNVIDQNQEVTRKKSGKAFELIVAKEYHDKKEGKPIEHGKVEANHKIREVNRKDSDSKGEKSHEATHRKEVKEQDKKQEHPKELEKKESIKKEQEAKKKNLSRKNAIDKEEAQRLKKEANKEQSKPCESAPIQAKELDEAKEKQEQHKERHINRKDEKLQKPIEEPSKESKDRTTKTKEIPQHEELTKPKEGEVKKKETKGQRRKRKRRNKKLSANLKEVVKEQGKRRLSKNYEKPVIEVQEEKRET